MQQAQAQQIADDFKKKLDLMSPDERASSIKQMTETITAINQDMKGMVGILQEARDKRETDELKAKMQIG